MKAEHLSVRIEHGLLIVEGERTGPHLHVSATGGASASSEPRADAGSPESDPATVALYPVRELKYGKIRREINIPAGVNVSLTRTVHSLFRWLTPSSR